jgi:hypothetical protein
MLIWSGLMLAMTALQAQNWTLVWADEFEGRYAEHGPKWSYMIGDGTEYGLPSGWGNERACSTTVRETWRSATGNLHTYGQNGRIPSDTKQLYLRPDPHQGTRGTGPTGRLSFGALMPLGTGTCGRPSGCLPTDEAYGGWAGQRGAGYHGVPGG